ncbi:MAG: flavin reductase family protein, partial [Priestia megaterium]
MKVVDPAVQSAKDNYHLLTGVVIPRPIAFITSQNDDGVVNAAPFSFFNVVAAEPPLIAVSVSRSEGQMTKDTAKNISASKEFVVHLVDESLVEQVNQAASSYPSSVSEVEETGLTLAPSKKVQVPGIQEASIRMECKLHQIVPLGTDEAYSSDLFIGEVVMFHISEEVIEN